MIVMTVCGPSGDGSQLWEVWCYWAAGSFGLALCPKKGNCRAHIFLPTKLTPLDGLSLYKIYKRLGLFYFS